MHIGAKPTGKAACLFAELADSYWSRLKSFFKKGFVIQVSPVTSPVLKGLKDFSLSNCSKMMATLWWKRRRWSAATVRMALTAKRPKVCQKNHVPHHYTTTFLNQKTKHYLTMLSYCLVKFMPRSQAEQGIACEVNAKDQVSFHTYLLKWTVCGREKKPSVHQTKNKEKLHQVPDL